MKRIISSVVAALMFAGSLLAISGCNAVAGAGRDIERGGQKLQDKADEHR
jgi:predicted small secreted protein